MKQQTRQSKFEKICKLASETTGVSVWFFPDEGTPDGNIHEDDGNLHITKAGLHAAFDVGQGQSLDGKEQNARTRAVLTALKLEKHINTHTLVEEITEEDECPYCRRSY